MATKNQGKQFETDIENSCKDQGIFHYRIKDTFIPPDLRSRVRVSKNNYDSFIYKKPNLFPIEFKSSGQKSVSFDEKIIKAHQIKALQDAVKYDGLIAGFIFNFRECENKTYFVHIDDFTKIKDLSENQLEHNYINKLNKSSISEKICAEVGIEIKQVKKKVKYRYYINHLLDELIERYGD